MLHRFRSSGAFTFFLFRALCDFIFSLQAKEHWSHDTFFDYVDRWIQEDDSAFVKAIKDAADRDHDEEWARQDQARDAFLNETWAMDRLALKASADRWKQEHDDAHYHPAIAKLQK